MYRSVYYCYQCCVIITDPLRYLEDVVARAVPDRKLYRDVVGHCKRAARDDELWAALRRVAALVAYTLLGLSVLVVVFGLVSGACQRRGRGDAADAHPKRD